MREIWFIIKLIKNELKKLYSKEFSGVKERAEKCRMELEAI